MPKPKKILSLKSPMTHQDHSDCTCISFNMQSKISDLPFFINFSLDNVGRILKCYVLEHLARLFAVILPALGECGSPFGKLKGCAKLLKNAD